MCGNRQPNIETFQLSTHASHVEIQFSRSQMLVSNWNGCLFNGPYGSIFDWTEFIDINRVWMYRLCEKEREACFKWKVPSTRRIHWAAKSRNSFTLKMESKCAAADCAFRWPRKAAPLYKIDNRNGNVQHTKAISMRTPYPTQPHEHTHTNQSTSLAPSELLTVEHILIYDRTSQWNVNRKIRQALFVSLNANVALDTLLACRRPGSGCVFLCARQIAETNEAEPRIPNIFRYCS